MRERTVADLPVRGGAETCERVFAAIRSGQSRETLRVVAADDQHPVGAPVATADALLGRPYRSLAWRDIAHALVSSARLVISIGMLIAGALVCRHHREDPGHAERAAEGLRAVAARFLLIVNVKLLVLGCALEGSTIIL